MTADNTDQSAPTADVTLTAGAAAAPTLVLGYELDGEVHALATAEAGRLTLCRGAEHTGRRDNL